jgi:bacteriocin-like protein
MTTNIELASRDELTINELEAVNGGTDKVKSTRGAEEVQHSEFTIVKLVDAATP